MLEDLRIERDDEALLLPDSDTEVVRLADAQPVVDADARPEEDTRVLGETSPVGVAAAADDDANTVADAQPEPTSVFVVVNEAHSDLL